MDSSSGDVLVVEGLWKVYPGGVEALRGVSFRVRRGEVFGLVGPNGAGKTTAFRVIAGLLRPTNGRVLVDGVDVHSETLEARKRLTYVPEEVGGYRRLTGMEYLRFIISVYLSARGEADRVEEAVEEAARLSGLPREVLERRRMGDYSKGMKRRVQVSWALAVRPSLAILDEPTSGLDVEASYELRSTIRRYASGHGIAVLLSSHDMREVERLCDRVALIKDGRIVAVGEPARIIEETGSADLEEAYMKLVADMRG
ncbi:MAG: ABC transporter ATP-binding protein [Crenarchaeota archaeon]|nr:ABC transporter ATP-binding protein [Thermoproteota archaeon]